jgi:glutamate decarboxylase
MDIAATVKMVLDHTPSTWHPGFLCKLYGSPDPVGIVADMVASVINANAHVWQASPVLIAVEKATCRQLADLIGFGVWLLGGVKCI